MMTSQDVYLARELVMVKRVFKIPICKRIRGIMMSEKPSSAIFMDMMM